MKETGELCVGSKSHCIPTECKEETSPSPRCKPGESFCDVEDACFKPCRQHTKCPPGKSFCLRTGGCLATRACEGGGGQVCGRGFTFCAERGGCVWGRCPSSAPPVTSCPPGTVSCGFSLEKQQQEAKLVLLKSSTTNHIHPLWNTCHQGEEWCEAAGRCVVAGVVCEDKPTHPPPLPKCPLPQILCVSKGFCVDPKECQDQSNNEELKNTIQCQPGTILCVSKGFCVDPKECQDQSNNEDLKNTIQCQPGTILCVSKGFCVDPKECQDQSNNEELKSTIQCQPGTILCVSKGFCVDPKECQDQSNNEELKKAIQCQPGTVFCTSMDSCQPRELCIGGVTMPDPDSLHICPPNKDDELPSLQCPVGNAEEDTQISFLFTSCLSDRHCPFGFTCCPDQETLHLQCVNASSKTDDTALNMTCSLLDAAEYDTKLKCNSPSECPPTSVCCNGTCRSKKGINSCPLTTLYCPVTKTCVRLGEKCGSVCSPKTVFCSTNNSCVPKEDCITGNEWEAPWTMPYIQRTSLLGSRTEGDGRGDGVPLSDTFSGAPTVSIDSSNVLHEVINMTTWYGSWSYLESNQWTSVEIGSRLIPSNFIRYELNSSSYTFGLDYIILQEIGTNVTRMLVQLVAPESPVVKIVDVVSSIDMVEDSAMKIKLTDIVNFTCDDEHYWMAWQNAVARDLVRTAARGGFLDYRSRTVRLWVNLLQHPELPPDREELEEDSGCGWDDESMGNIRGPYGTRFASRNNNRMSRGHGGVNGQKNNHDKEKRVQNNEDRGTGDNERGLFLQWAQQFNSRYDDMITVKYLNKNYKWRTMNLDRGHNLQIVSCENAQNTWLMLDPSLNVDGSFTLNISVYPVGEDTRSSRNTQNNEPSTFSVTIKVEGINDPPEALAAPIHSEIPTIEYGQTITGIPVSRYLKPYYVDPDGEPFKSMLLLYATGGFIDIQFSVDAGITYDDVVIKTDPFPSELQVAMDHQGIVDLEQEMSKQSCITDLIKNSNDLSSVAEGNKCLQKSKKKLAMKGFKTVVKIDDIEVKGSPWQERKKRAVGDRPEILRQFEGFPGDLLSSFPVVRSLCIPASGLLKFSSSRPSWTLVEGIQNTGLVYTASDANCSDTNPEAAVWLNYTLAEGFREGVEKKHAVDPVSMSILMTDCTGQPFLFEPRTNDACGVCGGDNSSCTDCAGIINGNAIMSCGECVGGGTGKPTDSSCNTSTQTGTNIDSQPLCQEPFIFSCGVCGNSSRKDKCGVCFGNNECVGCDGEVRSGAIIDACGKCLKKDDPIFNDCLVLQYTGDTLDAAVNSMQESNSRAPGRLRRFSVVEVNVIGLKSKYEAESCSLENDDSQISMATRVRYKKRAKKLSASFKTLLSGEVTFKCSFKLKNKKKKPGKGGTERETIVEMKTLEPIMVVDSRALVLESNVAEVETTQNMIVMLTLKDAVPLDHTTCFLVYPEESTDSGKAVKGGRGKTSRTVRLLDTKTEGEKTVLCLVPKNIRPGQAQIGLQVTKAAKVLMQKGLLNLPMLPLTLKAGVPEVVSAFMKSDGEQLVLKFNMNVNSETDCSNIIKWPWKDTSQTPPPVCYYLASILIVELGSNIEINPNTLLTFNDGNGIRRHPGDSTTAPEATGSFPVIQQQSQSAITFRLTGITKACNTSFVNAKVSRIKGIKIKNVQPEWNITFVPGEIKQQEILSVWNSLEKIKDNMVTTPYRRSFLLKVPGSLFLPDIEYLVVAYLKGGNGEKSEPQSMTVTTLPRNESLQVSINGPTSGLADVNYVYSVVVSPCLEPDKEAVKMEYKYIWNLDVPWDATMVTMEGTFITIPGNKLQGGRTYTLSVVVHGVQDASITGSSQLKIDIASQGIKVVTSAEFLQISSVSHLTLDASKSVDLDNRPGSLEYRWSCLTEDDKRCIVNGSRFLEDEILTTESILKVWNGSLVTGQYNFSVKVSKGNVSAMKDVMVDIIEGSCPVIDTKPPTTRVDPNQRIIVPAIITGVESISEFEIQWMSVEESGYLDADLSQIISGEVDIIKGLSAGVEERFDLVLPAPGVVENFVSLVGDGQYKFRVKVTTTQGITCSNDVIIKPNSPPKDGSIQVTPTTGEALITEFMFNTSGWTDELSDMPLSYYFGYDNGETPVGWRGPYIDEEPADIFTLPFGNEGEMTAVVKVCDVHDSCTVKEGPTLTLTLPSQGPTNLLSTLLDNIKEQFNEKVKMALFAFRDQLQTLILMGDQDKATALKTIADSLTLSQVSSVTASLNNEASVKKAEDIMDGVVVMISNTGGSNELLDKVPTLTKLYSEVVLDDPTSLGRIIFPNNNNRRRKREVQQSTSQEEDTQEMTEEVKRVLASYEAVIEEKEGSASTDTNTLDTLLKDLPKYLSGMSKGMSAQDDAPREVQGSMVALKVKRSNLIEESDEPFYFANFKGSSDDSDDSQVIWGSALSEYEEWYCGMKGDEMEKKLCRGACVTTVILKDDYFSTVNNIDPPGKLKTYVAKTTLLNPDTYVEIPVIMKEEDRITYELSIMEGTTPEGYKFKCYGWSESEWDGRLCSTGKASGRLHCSCSSPVYVAGFLIKDSMPSRLTVGRSEEPTNDNEESTTTENSNTGTGISFSHIGSKRVRYIIEGDFNTIVGPNIEEFEASITTQMAKKLNVSEKRIYNLTVTEGSVNVEFDVLDDHTRTSGVTAEQLYNKLEDIIKSGGLVIYGSNNQEIKVPAQALDGSGPKVEEKVDPTRLPIIIGSIIGGIVLVVMVFVCIAIYLKNKKRMDKVQPLQMSDSKQPTYSSIHFDQAMDGTMASLVKNRNPANRSLSSGGSYADEGIFIERRSTASSSKAPSGPNSAGGRRSYDSGNVDDREDVPKPFRYKSPTKEDLERSGPIPEHIIKKMKEDFESLPGTPGSLQ
ncbi:hypothetical protein Pcinc_029406 [Petrolisthes cinctipes]|uniref:PKD/REJ-like domain-containing protein n=1 Tax=Petrolisthes cinctipes TaxID=88211 RepID=A0AAE1F119_PETCI|nr:hypothetical protein Pcinc_029406 [Petrolisthes cinctipes]